MPPTPQPQPGPIPGPAEGPGSHRASTAQPRWAQGDADRLHESEEGCPESRSKSRLEGWLGSQGHAPTRLTLLVSSAERSGHGVAEQLPRLLEPAGIHCLPARSGEEAQQVLKACRVHIAVIDLAIPLRAPRPVDGSPAPTSDAPGASEAALSAARAAQAQAGARLLQLLRRLDSPPPTIVIRPPQPSLRDSARGLSDALREGAFAVLDRPLQLEAVLDALRRIISRHYAHVWTGAAGQTRPPSGASPPPRRDRV